MLDFNSNIWEDPKIQAYMEAACKKDLERVIETHRNEGFDIENMEEFESSFKAGFKEGYKKGFEKGYNEKINSIARKLKEMGISCDDIMLCTGLNQQQIETL